MANFKYMMLTSKPYQTNAEAVNYINYTTNFVSSASSIPGEYQRVGRLRESLRKDMNNVELIKKIMLQSGIIDEDGNVVHREMAGQR